MSRILMSSLFVITILLVAPYAQAQMGGLVLYAPLDDGSGNTATNTVGDDGTVNGAQWVAGNAGGALEFDGTASNVEFPVDLSPQAPGNGGAMTICAWVRVLNVGTDAHGQTRQPIVMKGNGGDGWEYALYVYDDFGAGLSVWNCGGSGVSEPSAPGVLPQDEWHHACGTFDTTNGVTVYVDGAEVAQATPNENEPCDGAASVYLGHREDGQFLAATIDEVAMWDRVLSVDEIVANMEGALRDGGTAVEPEGKLTTTWGSVKRLY